jgi:hypothetical protein
MGNENFMFYVLVLRLIVGYFLIFSPESLFSISVIFLYFYVSRDVDDGGVVIELMNIWKKRKKNVFLNALRCVYKTG